MQAGSVLYNLAEVYRYIFKVICMKIAFIIICHDGDDDDDYYHQFYYFSSFNDSEYMKILYVNCSSRNKYEITLHSYDHFLSSIEIKA